ncbi:tape measure protein [Mycobacterium phage Porcelain]|uniref:Tape measure protein n=1 Tax=Mycobacterium phage Superphikiman TaxID=2041551 RepID=A0A2D2W3V6_9CAUD|nr:tail length tape measure protein [Mycobacterium phage MiaZeal]AIY32386.1 tape measure protein [Mycobacterium phage MiaZeal]ASD50670.1 tape measure protein [Mycobacterium phage Porcelain]ATS92875.1 tape measure protein [Mycobacterium phage Superphikiman]
MARVDLWAFLHLNQKSMRNAEKEAVGRFQKIGRESADAMSKEIESAAPRVRRAMNRVTDATLSSSRAAREAKKSQDALAKSSQKVLELEEQIGEQKKKSQRLRKSEIANQRLETKAQKARNEALEEYNRLVDRRNKKSDAHKQTREEIRLADHRIKQLRLEGKYKEAKALDKEIHPTRKKSILEERDVRALDKQVAAGKADLDKKTKILKEAEENLKRVQKDRDDVVKSLTKSEEEHRKANDAAKKSLEDLRKANEDVEKAVRSREEAVKSLHEAEEAEEEKRRKRVDRDRRGGRGRRGGGGLGVIGNMLTDLPFVPSGRAGAFMGGGLLITMASAMEAVVTASQSLALTPAILMAAGAGFGTLALGVSGFGDAIKDMGDPEKFAEALQSLSPAAQQAALEIQYLVDGPLGDLKKATQETLFEGVAQRFRSLTNTFQPEIMRLTTGIAGAMNGMFDEFTNQLMTPGSQKAISSIIDDIVKAFQNLQPAIAPFTNALLKISETGASFLPDLATGLANAATSFSRFITEAQRSGKLEEFIQKGIDAAKSLGDAIWTIGGRIYEVFGNKSPEDFEKTLQDVIDAAFGLANGLVSASKAVNAVLKEIEPLTNLMKDHPGLVWAMIGAWVGFKGLGLVAMISGLAGGLGNVASALGKIPSLAQKAGAGISGALAAVSIPAWLKFLMRWGGAIGFGGQSDVKMPGDEGYPFDPNDPKYGEDALRRKAREKLGLPPEIPTGGAPGTGNGPHGRDGRRRWNPNAGRSATTGIGPAPADAGLPPWAPHDVPLPPADGGGKLSDSERRDQIWSSLNPNDFMPKIDVPMGPITPGTPRLEYGTDGKPFSKPGYGYTDVDQRAVADAQEKVRRAALDLRDARMEVAILEQDSLATEREIFEAKEKLREEEYEFNQAQLDLVDELNGKWKKVKGGMSDANKLGAGLDDDLGISRGIAGLADNLVRLVGNLATAPLQAMLGKIAAQGDGSYGIIGMLFGKSKDGLEDYDSSGNYVGSDSSSGGGFSAPGQASFGAPMGGGEPYGLPVGTDSGGYGNGGGEFPPWVHQLGAAFGLKPSTYPGHQEKDGLNKGIDWSGPVENMQAFAEYLATIPGAMEQVIWSNPDGRKIGIANGQFVGPGTDQPGYYAKDWAGHQNHVHTRQSYSIPMPGGMPASAAGFSGPGSFGGSSGGGTPVFVTNWPFGGAIPGMGSPGSPGGPGQMGKMGTPITNAAAFSSFGNPGSPQAVANMIYQQAISRGYSPQEAQAIVAYAIGESGLNPNANGGPQGGPGGANEVVGLFQQKPDFARGGGIDPSLRTNAAANTHAYLNQLEQNRHLPIEQALPATSGGGPLATGANWGSLMSQAGQLLGGAGGPLSTGMPTGLPGGRAPGVAGGAAGGGLPGLFGGLGAAGGGAAGGALGQLAPQRQLPGTGMPGAAGAAAGAVGGLEAGQTAAGQGNNDYKPGEEGWQPQGGGLGVGGLMGAAIQGAMGAGSAMAGPAAPAASAAAQMAMQLIQRTIKYGGEVAAIGVEGLMETFTLGDSALGDMSKSWFGRLLGGLSQAKPALGGSAGKQDEKSAEKKGEQDPNADKQQQQGGLGGVNIGTFVQSPDKNNQQVMNQLNFMSYASGQPR